MQLQIELSFVAGKMRISLLDVLHKPWDRTVIGFGATFQILRSPCRFDHFRGRTAPAIPISEGNQPLAAILFIDQPVFVLNAVDSLQ